MRTMKWECIGLAILCGIAGTCSAAGDFQVSGTRISILHLTDEAKAAIEAVENKDRAVVIIDKAAGQEDFAAICRLEWIRKLEFNYGNEGIHDLSPIAQLKNLQKLKIASAKASKTSPFDLGPLAQLTGLVDVDFYATKITNTQAMSSLKKLRKVSLYMSDVDSIDFLKNTPEIRVLNLYGANHSFKDYQPLLGLKKLRTLNIYMNPQATDELLAPLKALTSLQSISMSNSKKVTTLNFLENCKDLRTINAQWCSSLTNISAFTNMDMLESVAISNCQVSDISGLADKQFLSQLDISKTQVSDISALKDCVSLEALNISETSVSDISALGGCPELETLKIQKTPIKDISSLSMCYGLQQLNIQETSVEDLSFLVNCDFLNRLEISETVAPEQIDDLKSIFPDLTLVAK